MAKPWYKDKAEVADPEGQKPLGEKYRRNWDKIFGKPKKAQTEKDK